MKIIQKILHYTLAFFGALGTICSAFAQPWNGVFWGSLFVLVGSGWAIWRDKNSNHKYILYLDMLVFVLVCFIAFELQQNLTNGIHAPRVKARTHTLQQSKPHPN